MDVDNEIDQSLLQQFSCMGTTDRDVLIAQLHKLVGHQLNPTGCAFYLDMNNWNLQAAVCAYYDLESPKENLPGMSLVKDVTIGEGESVPPNTKFIKTWRLLNSGPEHWPPGCSLKFTSGSRLSVQDRVLVDSITPHETTDVSVEMVSPEQPGIYQGQWRMCTATGSTFGEIIWVILSVAEGGILGLTQQMSQFNELGSSQNDSSTPNPFATNQQKLGVDSNAVISAHDAFSSSTPFISPSMTINTSPVLSSLYQANENPEAMNNAVNDEMMY